MNWGLAACCLILFLCISAYLKTGIECLVLGSTGLLLLCQHKGNTIWHETRALFYRKRKVRKNHLQTGRTLNKTIPPNLRHRTLHPSMVSDWVRSTRNVGRHKTVNIHEFSHKPGLRKGETEVTLVEGRPFVEATIAGCITTPMLVDYGASTSVISRSMMQEIESKLGTCLPRIPTTINIKGYGGHVDEHQHQGLWRTCCPSRGHSYHANRHQWASLQHSVYDHTI